MPHHFPFHKNIFGGTQDEMSMCRPLLLGGALITRGYRWDLRPCTLRMNDRAPSGRSQSIRPPQDAGWGQSRTTRLYAIKGACCDQNGKGVLTFVCLNTWSSAGGAVLGCHDTLEGRRNGWERGVTEVRLWKVIAQPRFHFMSNCPLLDQLL